MIVVFRLFFSPLLYSHFTPKRIRSLKLNQGTFSVTSFLVKTQGVNLTKLLTQYSCKYLNDQTEIRKYSLIPKIVSITGKMTNYVVVVRRKKNCQNTSGCCLDE